MKPELRKNVLEKIAKERLSISTLEKRYSDGLDFYDNDEGSIDVKDLKDTLNYVYALGYKDANKVTKIKLESTGKVVEIGRKVTLYGIEYTIVGIDNDYTVFACLNPRNSDEATIKSLLDSEIEELIEDGTLKL